MFQLHLEDFVAVQHRFRDLLRITPTLPSLSIPEIFFKAENLQLTGSFKVRTAFNQVDLLSSEGRQRGVVASSSGNFAQALGYACRTRGVSAKIVMMPSASPLKVQRTSRQLAEVVFCEDRFPARAEKVEQISREEGRVALHPYDTVAGIAGNGTIGLEILQQFPQVKNVVVPVSGGGLIAGIAHAIKLVRPDVQVWGVQPKLANSGFLSYLQKMIVSIDKARSIADGLAATRPGAHTFPLIVKYVDGFEQVEEDSILAAVKWFLEEERLVVEPAGAVPLAAVFEEKVPAEDTVLVTSGGNVSPELLGRVIG